MYEVIIIGRGPAGLSAGIYTSIAGLSTLIIGKENDIWKDEVIIKNFFGNNNISGKKLMVKGTEQAEDCGAEIINDEVLSVKKENELFIVKTKKENYESKFLLIATGVEIKKSGIKNEEKFVGKGVSYCTMCDAFFFKNKKVVVIGNEDYGADKALELIDFTQNITLITNSKEMNISEDLMTELKENDIEIIDKEVSEIKGDKKVESLIIDGEEFRTDGVFVFLGSASSIDFARELGIEIKNYFIKVDDNQETNTNNVWAAGDCTGGLLQVCKAVSEGAVAGQNIIKRRRK